MRTYVRTTGTAFAMILLAHLLRIAGEGWATAWQPVFALTTLASAGMCACRRAGAAAMTTPSPAS
jgi:hypothetical protein